MCVYIYYYNLLYICGIFVGYATLWVYLKMGIHPSYCNLNGDLVANHQIIGDAVFRQWVGHSGKSISNRSVSASTHSSKPLKITVSVWWLRLSGRNIDHLGSSFQLAMRILHFTRNIRPGSALLSYLPHPLCQS